MKLMKLKNFLNKQIKNLIRNHIERQMKGRIKMEFKKPMGIQVLKRSIFPGSFTVEAALIMPMIIYLLFSLFYLTFYLHDINRVHGYMDKILYQTSLLAKHESDIMSGEITYTKINQRGIFYFITGDTEMLEDDIRKYITEELSDGLFIMQVIDSQVKVDRHKLEAKIKIQTKMPRKGILTFFQPSKQTVIEKKYIVHDPADTIRMSEVILDTGSKVKGLKELRNLAETVFNYKK